MEASDPIIASLVVLLTFLLRKLATRLRGPHKTLAHYYSPAAATLIAIGLQAAWLTISTDAELTLAAVVRGFLAGCVAVTGHSQYREIIKQIANGKTQPTNKELTP